MFKDLKRIEILAILAIILLYFVSRVISINNFPIFTDEAIYLRWAQIAKNDAAWRFISLTDGKQPFYIWLTIVAMKAVQDPIIAGRLISVFSGSATIISLILLGKTLFQKWSIGILAGFLYTIFPFALVYDRMALMDGTLGSLMTWTLLFQVILARTMRLDVTLILGWMIGLSALTKTSGFLSLYLSPIFLLLVNWGVKQKKAQKFFWWIALILVSLIVSQMMYAILRLSPYFHIIAQKDQTFVYSLSEWIKHPLTFFFGNLNGLMDWTFTYLTWPIIIAILLGLIWGKEFIKEKLVIFSWFIIPLTGLALFGKVIYPRFIFFMTIPLLLIFAYLIEKIKIKKLGKIVVFSILMILPLRIDYDLLTKPTKAQIPFSDSHQYFNDWPSGWGIKESIDFFRNKSKEGKITVYTEGTFGLMPASLELYLVDDKNVTIKGIWPVPEKVPVEILEEIKNKPAYIIFFQYQPPPAWNLEKIAEFKKGDSNRFLTLYQILGQK